MSDTRRLFFALWPTAELRDRLAARTNAATAYVPCHPMASSNLHVTLAFIGSVAVARVAELTELGKHIKFAPCELVFDRLAIWKQARVLVLTASQTPVSLQQFLDELQVRLSEAGFHVDDRPFHPHVTLARDVRAHASDEPTAPLIWTAGDFVLVESVATKKGVQYPVLETFT